MLLERGSEDASWHRCHERSGFLGRQCQGEAEGKTEGQERNGSGQSPGCGSPRGPARPKASLLPLHLLLFHMQKHLLSAHCLFLSHPLENTRDRWIIVALFLAGIHCPMKPCS